ncbi:unnamed protein product, partial [Lactuca virosa]
MSHCYNLLASLSCLISPPGVALKPGNLHRFKIAFILVPICLLTCDLGKMFYSNHTFTLYESTMEKWKVVLVVGAISYANAYPLHNKSKSESWASYVERNIVYQPWIWSAENPE